MKITMDNHSAAEFVELIEKNNGIHNFPQKAPLVYVPSDIKLLYVNTGWESWWPCWQEIKKRTLQAISNVLVGQQIWKWMKKRELEMHINDGGPIAQQEWDES